MNLTDLAGLNLAELTRNPYAGRGFVIGKMLDGRNVIVYWIMGRDPATSANRVFVQNDEGCVRTAIADLAKLPPGTKTHNILYNAMIEAYGSHIVSNGDQTDSVVHGLMVGENMEQALATRTFEDDAPNYTSRITAIVRPRYGAGLVRPNVPAYTAEIGVLHRADWSDECLRSFYRYPSLPQGFGLCVHTYADNGKPLPKFRGDPVLLPIVDGSPEEIANFFWARLNPGNRVAIAAKVFAADAKGPTRAWIVNKYAHEPAA